MNSDLDSNLVDSEHADSDSDGLSGLNYITRNQLCAFTYTCIPLQSSWLQGFLTTFKMQT